MNPRIQVVTVPHTPVITIIIWKWSIHYASLTACSTHYTAVQIENNVATMTIRMVPHTTFNGATPIDYCLKIEVKPAIHSSMNQERFSVSKYPLWKIRMIKDSIMQRKPSCANRHFSLSAKMNGTLRRTLVSPWRMHWTYWGMSKGTPWAEATSSSKKNQAIVLVIIKLC